MKERALGWCLLLVSVAGWTGCGTYHRRGVEPVQASQLESRLDRLTSSLSREREEMILGLNPARVTTGQIRTVLSNAPAPRIINIHGGIASVIPRMVSFSEFLIGMGYPGASLTNAADGTYTFSCYEDSRMIAGVIAWYYEKEGLRPIIVGHSQGGMQAVKVLHKLAGPSASKLPVWNPLTWHKEPREEITDPLTGQSRTVVGLTLPYVTAVGAGGVTRLLPNQWDLLLRLRVIPDSVEEFTGFYKGPDLLGGDFLGYGAANHFRAEGSAAVRNIRLPGEYEHGAIPDTKHLLASPEIVEWINEYQPADTAPPEPQFEADSRHILWAADVWYSIKKHWVLELQRLIRARRAQRHEP